MRPAALTPAQAFPTLTPLIIVAFGQSTTPLGAPVDLTFTMRS